MLFQFTLTLAKVQSIRLRVKASAGKVDVEKELPEDSQRALIMVRLDEHRRKASYSKKVPGHRGPLKNRAGYNVLLIDLRGWPIAGSVA